MKEEERRLTANEYTDIKDILKGILYTKSGYALGYLRLFPINIDLITREEKETLCNNLTAEFKPEKEMFSILSIPRTVDMEAYIDQLNSAYNQEVENPQRKFILQEMIKQASDSVLNGENFEHQYYLKVWSPYNPNVPGTERQIYQRLMNFQNRYESAQNSTKEMDENEILKLCNLFANSSTAILEEYEDISYTPISRIKEG